MLFADHVMALGFKHACLSGISAGKDDLIIPEAKETLVTAAQERVEEYERQYLDVHPVTQGEKYNKVVDVGQNAQIKWPMK